MTEKSAILALMLANGEGGGSGTDSNAVHYTADSNKTAEQKQQARDNIGVTALLADKADTSVVADAYDNTATYAVGDYCINDGVLYKCNTAISTAEEWTAAHWTEKQIVDEFGGGGGTGIDLGITGASVGQYPVIKTVDSDGKPTAWEADSLKFTITVTCVTQDGVTVTGQTVTLRNGSATGAVFGTAAYNGQPVSFRVPFGFNYYVSVSDTLASHFNPTTASGIATADISATLTYSDFSSIRTARDIKSALDSGIDLTALVGEQITCAKGSRTLTWDVADYDSNLKEITLLLHDTLPDQMIFEPAQALAYFESGLAAGNYYFGDGSTNYYFTLASAIPEGGQIIATTSQFWTYASQSDTVQIESGSVSTTSIEGATTIGTVASGEMNHMDRVNYGGNNYAECGLRQWLNSTAEANTLMPRINKLSRPYSVNLVGFLRDLDSDFIACLEDTVWKCNTNNIYEAPASIGYGVAKSSPYTVTDKIGLASQREIFGSYDGTDAGDAVFDLYANAVAADRIKYYNSSARIWWLRSPDPGSARGERNVYASGVEYDYRAHVSYGAVPACKIRKST